MTPPLMLRNMFESEGGCACAVKALPSMRPAIIAMVVVVALLFTLQFATGSGSQVRYSFFRNQLESAYGHARRGGPPLIDAREDILLTPNERCRNVELGPPLVKQ